MNEMDLAKAIFGKDDKTSTNTPSVQFGTAVSNSVDGTVSVIVDGETVNQVYEDDDGNLVEDAHVDLPCEPNVQSGDVVRITTVNGAPTVSGVVGGGDRTYDVAASAADAAASAQASADAAQNSANAAAAAAGAAQTSADEAATAAASAQADATAAGTAAAQAISDAATAQGAADAAQADATAAGTAADVAKASADAAQQSATNANAYASRALGNLSTVQSVAETLAWVSEHGTMTHTTDTAPDPTHVYFVADPSGDYTVGGATYGLVTEPDEADLGSYYELSIDESLNNYVGTHLALTDDGLWLLPAATGTYKVLVSTGAGSTYTTPGTYIIDGTGGNIAAFKGDGISFDSGTAFMIGDESAYIHFDGDGHINIGGTGITIGGSVSLADLLRKYDATITADDISVTKTGTTATITVGSETVTISDGAKGDKGDTGDTGAQGVSVSSVVHQYYLSTSSSSQAGGSWTVTPADYVTGRYYWERWLITFSDNSTAYTEATLAKEVTSAWTAIESNSEQIALKANSTDVYTKAQTDGLISQEVTDRNSAIEQSAESITSSVSATYATKTEVGQKADNSTVTALSTRVTQTEADVTTAITGVNGLNALVRQYADGVLVCRQGNTIGALVNADGSFDIVSVTWDGDTPTAGAVLTSFGADGSRVGRDDGVHSLQSASAFKLLDRNATEFTSMELENDEETGLVLISYQCTTDGSTKAFTVRSDIVSLESVRKNGTVLVEGTDYTVSGRTVTLSVAPTASDDVWINYRTDEPAPAFTFGTRAAGAAVGQYSIAEGSSVESSDLATHAEGMGTHAGNACAHAEGYQSTASGECAHAEGNSTQASGENAHAEGNNSKATGLYSHSEGGGTEASGKCAHAEGYTTTASGICAHSEGHSTVASGNQAHASGLGTIASGDAQMVFGKFNKADANKALIIGNGTSDTARSNALTVGWDGSVRGNVKVLYNNTTGTTGTVTLSATAANYNHMRIYFRTSWVGRASVDVYAPNGKSVALNISEVHDWPTASIMYVTRVCAISGKSITRSYEYGLSRSFSSGAMQGHSDSNYIYIIRVEGWNE